MQSRLIVKNFGPIKEVNLDLRNVNVFIGPQASGKSALAKLFTIFKAPRKFLKNGNAEKNSKAFIDVLEEYNIASFLKPETIIIFDCAEHTLVYSENAIAYNAKLKNKIDDLESAIKDFPKSSSIDFIIKKKIREIQEENNYQSIQPYWHQINLDDTDEKKNEQFLEVFNSAAQLENYLSTQAPTYIAAERGFINIIKEFSFNLLLNNIPIPKHILLLGAELEKSTVQEIDLGFLDSNLVYRNVNGKERIFIDEQTSIKLLESASGIQSVVNILIPILSQDKSGYQRSFVIEEPELNLFPDAQYALIKLIESLRQEAYSSDTGAIHIYTTHSPYILAAFNNLLYASKVWNEKGSKTSAGYVAGIEDKLKHIIPPNANIQPNIFSAYQIRNGIAESIINRETGMITDNFIDDTSDKMADDFDSLINLMK